MSEREDGEGEGESRAKAGPAKLALSPEGPDTFVQKCKNSPISFASVRVQDDDHLCTRMAIGKIDRNDDL